MDKKEIQQTIQFVKKNSPKRNFKQSIDMIILIKDLDLKNTDNHLNLFVPIHFSAGKKRSVCGLVGPELVDQAKEFFDEVVNIDDFEQYQKDPKKAKKLAAKHDFFVAQANIMPKVATAFGRVLGSRGKMPNPKAGCVVPPAANLQVLHEKLQKFVKITMKSSMMIQCQVGRDDSKEEEVVDNIITIYDHIIHHLPQEQNNIKNVLLKLTMGPAIAVGKLEVPKKTEEIKPKAKVEKKEEEPLAEKEAEVSE